jgi:mannose-6-phosphate isomerase-like protein (cupin superfamily)
MKADKGRLIDLSKIMDPRGNLTLAEQCRDVPFEISRVYWVYDVPSGECRGGHAHKHCKEFLIAISGSFSVTLDDGKTKDTILLNHPYQGLLIETGVWRTLDDFSSGAVCLVLASDYFEEEDYIRDYGDFLRYLEHYKLEK